MAHVGLGFELVAPVLVGMFVGYRLDRWAGTEPWLLLLGALLGIAAGILALLRQVMPPKDRPGGSEADRRQRERGGPQEPREPGGPEGPRGR